MMDIQTITGHHYERAVEDFLRSHSVLVVAANDLDRRPLVLVKPRLVVEGLLQALVDHRVFDLGGHARLSGAERRIATALPRSQAFPLLENFDGGFAPAPHSQTKQKE